MGTDIEVWLEKQTEGNWKMVESNLFEMLRDYRLFAKLANIRTSRNEAFVPPRGVPLDADEKMSKEYNSYHDLTWYELDELLDFLKNSEAIYWAYYPGGNGEIFDEIPRNGEGKPISYCIGAPPGDKDSIGWKQKWDIIPELEDIRSRYPNENVRLIIGFSS
jgi:hypothetical protein